MDRKTETNSQIPPGMIHGHTRREFIRKVLLTTAYTAPIITTFSVSDAFGAKKGFTFSPSGSGGMMMMMISPGGMGRSGGKKKDKDKDKDKL
ncbi:MAG: hypothetical protein O2807_14410 [bacterium]|nr:hypothetical protein [bacterium]